MEIQITVQLLIALLLGAVIGLEREYKGKGAGLQTYSLVCVGACLFTILSFEFFGFFADKSGVSFDPSRVILAVATGIGFIGGGVIIHRRFSIEGLTTAAGLWMASAIGVAVGAGLYFHAVAAAFFTTVILIVFGELERKYFGKDD